MGKVKFIKIAIFICFLFSIANGQTCKENPADENEHAVCAMEIVTFSKVKTSEITGIVTSNGEAFENAIVELYKISESKTVLVRKFKTQKDGRFCFTNLSKGIYRLKTASSKFEFKCTQIEVEIKGKTKRLITLPIEVGN